MKARWVLAVCLLAAALALAVPTITVTPSTAAPGSIVTISITGQDAETCGIEIRDPANTVIFTKQITLSNGAGSVQWGIPSDARAGDYTVYVSCTTSGTATATLTVTPLVGGEVKKDYTPFILTLAVATIAAASFVLLKRELKG
jgi:hypothetical protein